MSKLAIVVAVIVVFALGFIFGMVAVNAQYAKLAKQNSRDAKANADIAIAANMICFAYGSDCAIQDRECVCRGNRP